jgi:hypothetical protein
MIPVLTWPEWMFVTISQCWLSLLQLHGFAERYHPAVALNSDVKPAQQQIGIRAFLKEISGNNTAVPKQGK